MKATFYMTLPSNASMYLHPDNTLPHYVTALPRRINLPGGWGCGIVEIQYPYSWCNDRETNATFFLDERDAKAIQQSSTIVAGYYYGPNRFLRHVNSALVDMSTDTLR